MSRKKNPTWRGEREAFQTRIYLRPEVWKIIDKLIALEGRDRTSLLTVTLEKVFLERQLPDQLSLLEKDGERA